MRANGEYSRLLHLRSVEDDTDTRINKKHSHCKLDKSQCGAALAAGHTQSILVAQENRKCRLLRQRNELQSIEILKRSAFVGTNPTEELITSGLPVTRSQSPRCQKRPHAGSCRMPAAR